VKRRRREIKREIKERERERESGTFFDEYATIDQEIHLIEMREEKKKQPSQRIKRKKKTWQTFLFPMRSWSIRWRFFIFVHIAELSFTARTH
jgi:hypothetical protein